MAGLWTPLSTLRRCPRGHLRMTRGRCGSLFLHRDGLAPPTPCRSPGALRSTPNNGHHHTAPAGPVRATSRLMHLDSLVLGGVRTEGATTLLAPSTSACGTVSPSPISTTWDSSG